MLSKKISTGVTGLWFLIGEHLRLGTWDLLKGLTGKTDYDFEPRIAQQLINESAACRSRIRSGNYITNQGFELLNGLRVLASDEEVHKFLNQYSMEQYRDLQQNLIKMRKINGHFKGEVIAIDPHRIVSHSKRIMPKKKKLPRASAEKMLQSYFLLDAQTKQPISFNIGSSGINLLAPTLQAMETAKVVSNNAIILADKEHYNKRFFGQMSTLTKHSLLVPAQENTKIKKTQKKLKYKECWTGYAVAEDVYYFAGSKQNYRLIVQREGLREDNYQYKSFLTTSDKLPEELMTEYYPERWTIESFFKNEGALGFDSASTLNLNVKFGKMNMALLAQAALYQFRQKLPAPFNSWDAEHLADSMFRGIDGDIRVKGDTIVVTCYNVPKQYNLHNNYSNLPQRLASEGIDPRIKWLYNFKLDFRFK
jgi:hypothetical protein